MPIRCYFKPEEKLVVFIHLGVISDDEFLSSYKAFHQDPRFEKSFNLLVDLRHAESSTRSPSALREISDFRHQWFPQTAVRPKIAVIAPKDLSFGLARMYESYSDTDPAKFVVFRAVDAALAWLGLPESLIDDLDQDTQPEDSSDS